MPQKWVFFFGIAPIFAWLLMTVWLLPTFVPTVEQFALSITLLGLSGLFFWVIYFITLSFTVLPKVDRLAYPDSYSRYKDSDNALLKLMRINMYTAAIRRKKSQSNDPFELDLRQLPTELKNPLQFHIRLLASSVAAGVLGSVILSILI